MTIALVGDDDQSIYSWRGGSPQFIRKFEEHFGSAAKVESLLHSRRCHRNVLEASLRVVETYDQHRRKKGTFTYESDDGPPLVVHNVPSEKREAAIILAIIREALPSKKVLVLVPSRGHAKLICGLLRKARIKYSAPEPPPGGGLFALERLVSWLRNIDDNIALRECMEAVLGTTRSPVPSKRARKLDKIAKREQALNEVSELWRDVLDQGVSLWESLTRWRGRSDALGFLHENLDQLRTLFRTDDLPEFLSQSSKALEPWKGVAGFADEVEGWVSRFGSASDAYSDAAVRVMTIQGSKGLEAETVCVMGLEEGTLPRGGTEGEELAEQSRLLFVSMTRAKIDLHLFHSRNRSGAVSFQRIHSGDGQHLMKPSPFLDAIPAAFLKKTYHPAQT